MKALALCTSPFPYCFSVNRIKPIPCRTFSIIPDICLKPNPPAEPPHCHSIFQNHFISPPPLPPKCFSQSLPPQRRQILSPFCSSLRLISPFAVLKKIYWMSDQRKHKLYFHINSVCFHCTRHRQVHHRTELSAISLSSH